MPCTQHSCLLGPDQWGECFAKSKDGENKRGHLNSFETFMSQEILSKWEKWLCCPGVQMQKHGD